MKIPAIAPWVCSSLMILTHNSYGLEKAQATQTPYYGTPHAIPGNIELEDYDLGGEGISYHDSDVINLGNSYRSDESVDIEPSMEGTFNIGWIANEEWFEYTIHVSEDNNYIAYIKTAAVRDGQASLSIDGKNKLDHFTLPSTGGWQTWQTVPTKPFRLEAGDHILRITANSDGFNLDSLNIQAKEKRKKHQSAYQDQPANIPGTIEIENYDNGGEGVAYHDVDNINEGGEYRQDGVDLEPTSRGGYNLGWTHSGEWLEYTVNVTEPGRYILDAAIGSMQSAHFRVEFDGEDKTGELNVYHTGHWQTWQTINSHPFRLEAGSHVMRVYITQGGFNLDSITLRTINY